MRTMAANWRARSSRRSSPPGRYQLARELRPEIDPLTRVGGQQRRRRDQRDRGAQGGVGLDVAAGDAAVHDVPDNADVATGQARRVKRLGRGRAVRRRAEVAPQRVGVLQALGGVSVPSVAAVHDRDAVVGPACDRSATASCAAPQNVSKSSTRSLPTGSAAASLSDARRRFAGLRIQAETVRVVMSRVTRPDCTNIVTSVPSRLSTRWRTKCSEPAICGTEFLQIMA